VALRSGTSCTLRVCEVMFNLLELLMDMGVLKKKTKDDSNSFGSQQKEESPAEPDNKQSFPTAKSLHEQQYTAHNLVLNTVLRLVVMSRRLVRLLMIRKLEALSLKFKK